MLDPSLKERPTWLATMARKGSAITLLSSRHVSFATSLERQPLGKRRPKSGSSWVLRLAVTALCSRYAVNQALDVLLGLAGGVVVGHDPLEGASSVLHAQNIEVVLAQAARLEQRRCHVFKQLRLGAAMQELHERH